MMGDAEWLPPELVPVELFQQANYLLLNLGYLLVSAARRLDALLSSPYLTFMSERVRSVQILGFLANLETLSILSGGANT